MFVFLVAGALAALCWYIQRVYTYWERRGVPTIPASIPYGNFGTLGTKHCHQELMAEIYARLKPTGEPFCGVYALFRPIVLLLDTELIKRVHFTDFDVFHDRGVFHNARDDPLSANLLTIEGQLWRDVRAKLTGIFTAAKMRTMFTLVGDTATAMVRTIAADARRNAPSSAVEIKSFVGGFMTDTIGVCAFGLELNSQQDADPVFRDFGKKTFDEPRNKPLHMLLLSCCPQLAAKLGCRAINEDVEDFYLGMVRRTIAQRELSGVRRNDFMDLMMDLRENSAGGAAATAAAPGLRLSVEQIAAESFAFFLAGLGTMTGMVSFAMYELAMAEDLQRRLRDEIYAVLGRHDGELTYDAMDEMKYLGQVMNESLRKYPPFGNTIREARRDYQVPGTKHIIPKGTRLWTPVMGLHHDPEYFPEPERFDPERFSDEATRKRDPMVFMPFGAGPRKCIGYRFATMVAKMAVVKMLTNFEFAVCAETNVPLKISKKFVLYEPTGGVTLAVSPLTDGRRNY